MQNMNFVEKIANYLLSYLTNEFRLNIQLNQALLIWREDVKYATCWGNWTLFVSAVEIQVDLPEPRQSITATTWLIEVLGTKKVKGLSFGR